MRPGFTHPQCPLRATSACTVLMKLLGFMSSCWAVVIPDKAACAHLAAAHVASWVASCWQEFGMSALAEYSCDVSAMLPTVMSNAVVVQGMAQSLLGRGGFQATTLTSMAQQLLCCCSPIELSQAALQFECLPAMFCMCCASYTFKDQHS